MVKGFFTQKLEYDKKYQEKLKENSLNLMVEIHEIQRQYYLDRIIKFFDSPGLEKIPPKEYEKLNLNRHLIAHGLYLGYDINGEINSLKLFLLLDLLNNILSMMEHEDKL